MAQLPTVAFLELIAHLGNLVKSSGRGLKAVMSHAIAQTSPVFLSNNDPSVTKGQPPWGEIKKHLHTLIVRCKSSIISLNYAKLISKARRLATGQLCRPSATLSTPLSPTPSKEKKYYFSPSWFPTGPTPVTGQQIALISIILEIISAGRREGGRY